MKLTAKRRYLLVAVLLVVITAAHTYSEKAPQRQAQAEQQARITALATIQ
jgi:hypothetical protein